jgi:hypothetical protein
MTHNDNKIQLYFIMEPPESINLPEEYLKTLSAKELQGYHIAKSHLGATFDLEKSIGFLEWKQRTQSGPATPA